MISNVTNEKLENLIMLDGVNCKGYGLIFKAVMMDNELSLVSKAIYAYFCSYTGSGACLFPRRETILKHLKLSKNGYYSHYNALIKQGYIRVEKKKGYLNKNIYVIVANPKKIKDDTTKKSGEGKLMLNGAYSKGYGFIPKAIMVDDRLNAKAKGLAAYFYCIAQSGCCVFPSRKDILYYLNISTTSYYNALKQLTTYDYISINQRTGINGEFAVNDYTLNTYPCAKKDYKSEELGDNQYSPSVQKGDNEEKLGYESLLPCIQNEDNGHKANVQEPCIQKEDNKTVPCIRLGDIQNGDNNNSTSNNTNIFNRSIYQENIVDSNVAEIGMKFDTDNVYTKGLPYCSQNIQKMDKCIRQLARLEELQASSAEKEEIQMYTLAINALIDMCTSEDRQRYRGELVSSHQVIEQVNLCCMDDYDGLSIRDLLFSVYVRYKDATEIYSIKNPPKYMKSVIWSTMNCFLL